MPEIQRLVGITERYMNLPQSFLERRRALSFALWDTISVGCDNGPIAKTGITCRLISEEWADRLDYILQSSKPIKLTRGDARDGYFFNTDRSSIHYLNGANDWRHAGRLSDVLREFLHEHAGWISAQIAHCWSVCSFRQSNQRPLDEPGGKHLDGWPKAIRKIFILPRGAGPDRGTTWFKLRDGRELTFDNPNPCLLIFENSAIEHAARPSPTGGRPTIEIDIVPSQKTCCDPIDAGLDGWYPWFPEQSEDHYRTLLANWLRDSSQIRQRP